MKYLIWTGNFHTVFGLFRSVTVRYNEKVVCEEHWNIISLINIVKGSLLKSALIFFSRSEHSTEI